MVGAPLAKFGGVVTNSPTVTAQTSGTTGLTGTYTISGAAQAQPSTSSIFTITAITTLNFPQSGAHQNYSLYPTSGAPSPIIISDGQWNRYPSSSGTASCDGAVGHIPS